MERFQKIRNNRRKFDISSICRFCGLENDERYNILQINEDGVEFITKVSSMFGIKVHESDQMPQNVCFICMDKINDFFEFRLMALNTEKQTRDALGLPLEVEEPEKPKPNIRKIIQTKPAFVRLIDLKHSTQDTYLIQKALQRLRERDEENIPSTSSMKRETTPIATVSQPPLKKSKKDLSCTICVDTYFSYINDLQDHQIKEHLPLIAKYACGSCRETFDQLSDFKSHETMHTQRRLPYICYFCKLKISKLKDFQKHMTNFNCPKKQRQPVLVEDIRCFQCKKKHLTQNLFEWHGCFLKTRGSCAKCGLYVQKKKSLLKHYVLCKEKFVTPEAARDPNAEIKFEEISPRRGAVVNISNASHVKTKGVRKKTVPQRRQTVFKAEKEVNLSHSSGAVSQEQQNDEEDEYANYEEDITYDNFGSDEDENQTITSLEPVVSIQEEQPGPRIIDIKTEGSNDTNAIKEHALQAKNTQQISPQLIRNIKREQAIKQLIVSTNKQKNLLSIKSEKSGNEQNVVQLLNPLAIARTKTAISMTARKKTFTNKSPQQIAMEIKKERFNTEYGDGLNATRDEAEPDPEEEKLMEKSRLSPAGIKLEKLDSEKNAVKVMSNPAKPQKQFINPIALAKMREKKAQKNAEPTSNGSGLLVISSVTSMSEVPSNGDSAEQTKELLSENVEEVPPKSPEKTVDENAQNNKLDKINSSNEENAPQESNPVMIEIPAEFSKSQEKEHNSPATVTDILDKNILSTVVAAAESEKKNEPIETKTDGSEMIAQAINDEDDELDQLLQKYESGDINDANELHDSDLQDLLKFD